VRYDYRAIPRDDLLVYVIFLVNLALLLRYYVSRSLARDERRQLEKHNPRIASVIYLIPSSSMHYGGTDQDRRTGKPGHTKRRMSDNADTGIEAKHKRRRQLSPSRTHDYLGDYISSKLKGIYVLCRRYALYALSQPSSFSILFHSTDYDEENKLQPLSASPDNIDKKPVPSIAPGNLDFKKFEHEHTLSVNRQEPPIHGLEVVCLSCTTPEQNTDYNRANQLDHCQGPLSHAPQSLAYGTTQDRQLEVVPFNFATPGSTQVTMTEAQPHSFYSVATGQQSAFFVGDAQAHLHRSSATRESFLYQNPIYPAIPWSRRSQQSLSVALPPSSAHVNPPICLYMSCDNDSLSEYQCHIRKQIEFFEALPEDVNTNAQGRNRPIVAQQVGIRCRC